MAKLEDFLPCAILLPSLGRPQYLAQAAKNIHINTDPHHEILWCVSGRTSKEVLDKAGEVYIDDEQDDDHRYVTRMNKLAKWAAERGAQTVFFGSDDVTHHAFWLEQAIEVMAEEQKACVVVNDGHNPNGTQALMLVEYFPFACFDDPKSVFHYGYHHNFADNEQFVTAQKYGQFARAMKSVVEHHHPNFQNKTSRPIDDTYRDAFAHWDKDGAHFGDRIQALKDEPFGKVAGKREGVARMWAGE
jgi:hypothetical protein